MNEIVGPDDVRASAAACHEALAGLVDRDWSILASGLDWSCRQTLEHIPSAQLFYASQLAVQAQDRLPRLRGGEDQLSAAETLLSVQVNAAILEHVLRAAPASARAFHPAGMADPSGFAGMSCDEILIHTLDITAGFGVDFQPPGDLRQGSRPAVPLGSEGHRGLGCITVGQRAPRDSGSSPPGCQLALAVCAAERVGRNYPPARVTVTASPWILIAWAGVENQPQSVPLPG